MIFIISKFWEILFKEDFEISYNEIIYKVGIIKILLIKFNFFFLKGVLKLYKISFKLNEF